MTVDRISNSGNPIADQSHNGKDIHVPAGDPGDILKLRLIDNGAYYRAEVVNTVSGSERSHTRVNPTTPAKDSPRLSDIADDLCDEMLPIATRHDSGDSSLGPNEYPDKNHRSEIAS